ncbi:MAG: family 43 glycosylhydrolase [Clostridiales bacterium]|nr:family 43 glycosylhydrolase [Clostridiales bacterium]
MKKTIRGANPYMPLWEHVPDGEPRVFEHNGETRVYVYGSHDTMRTEYCGKDYVVWSAPADDLTDWRCDGVCYESSNGSVLYAPDVVKKGDTYYLYSAENKGSKIFVSRSKSPIGPFTDPVLTDLGFDPGILVDDDGRVYAYWGFCACYCAELNEDMATIRPGTLHPHPMKHASAPWITEDDGHFGAEDAFFEASSPRKLFGKYVYIYSKRYSTPVPELGVYGENNGFLSYKYSDRPLDGFLPGGDISFNGGEILKNPDGTGIMTYRWGNNHGSIVEINGKWYVFYHRQTGTDEFSRQAMLEPIDVAMDKNGKIFIGEITYVDGEPVASKPVEMTSQGAQVNGLDAYSLISAGYACHLSERLTGSKQCADTKNDGTEIKPEAANTRPVAEHIKPAKAYIKPVYSKNPDISAPIVGITNGVTAGYRYLQFGQNPPKSVTAWIRVLDSKKTVDCARDAAETCDTDSTSVENQAACAESKEGLAKFTVNVRLDDYRGKICAVLSTSESVRVACRVSDATENENVGTAENAGTAEKSGTAENADVVENGTFIPVTAPLTCGVSGRHAVYFEFLSESEGDVAEFDRFTFDR